MQKYRIIKILGDGAFGTVYKAVNSKTNEVVAIKKMKSKYRNWEECLELRQIKSLRKINHPNIAKLKEVLLVSQELHLVFEYLDSNLYEEYSNRKKQGRPFSEKQVKNLMFQLANSLAHMHKNGFFHRDLKPQNLLVSGDILKICDFGLARQIRSRPPFTDYVSTRWYRAPELLLRSTSYNSPVDVFAFGCIMAQLFNLAPLFPGNNDADQLNRIVKVLGTPDANEWPEGYKLAKKLGYSFSNEIGVNLYELIPTASLQAIQLLQSTLKYSSRKRLTMTEILKHDYFKGIKLISQDEPKEKQIIFQQKLEGPVLNTSKQEKKLEQFRMTKQMFRQTRRYDALQSDPLKLLEKNHMKHEDNSDDIDNIIKELQEKRKKDKTHHRDILPLKFGVKQSRERFYTEVEHHPISKQEDYSYKRVQKTQRDEGPKKYQPNNHNYPGSVKKQPKNNVFSYGFQPTSLPSLISISLQRNQEISPLIIPKRNPVHFPSSDYVSKQLNPMGYKPKSLAPMIMPFRY